MRILGYRAGNTEKNAGLLRPTLGTGPKYLFNEDTFRSGTPTFVALNTVSDEFPWAAGLSNPFTSSVNLKLVKGPFLGT